MIPVSIQSLLVGGFSFISNNMYMSYLKNNSSDADAIDLAMELPSNDKNKGSAWLIPNYRNYRSSELSSIKNREIL
jgi:hypothetical protein